MNNVVSINRGRYSFFYPSTQKRKSNFEEKFLLTGTITSLALPPTICLAYGEIIPFMIFAGCTFLGIIMGVAMYYQRSSRLTLGIDSEIVPKVPRDKIVKLKKAA